MKKKIVAAALIVSMLSISALGTLAYFTDTGIAHNVITSGKVDITLNDAMGYDENSQPIRELKGVMPGVTYDKVVSVTNEADSQNAWVRIKLEKVIELAQGVEAEINPSLAIINLPKEEGSKWVKDGDYWYYTDILKPGDTTENLFETVTIDKNMGNEYQNSTVKILVTAEAVQADNNGGTYTEIKSWTEVPVMAE